ncbi:MAG: ABC transporter permease [Verrucomicrobia bacterium]|nr:ABC transporter permease [Verrucomicrobiota bacterium]
MNDFRYGLRMLAKTPGFTAVAVLTLALGISANTTIFSIISAMFFQPLPVKDPDRLVLVLQKSAVWKMPHGHSWLDFKDYRERVGAFEDVIATFMTPVHFSAPGQQPERAWIEAVSGNYFSMLGLEPAHGRFFQSGEGEKPGADPLIVLSHTYWQRKFGGDPAVVGRTVHVNGGPYTVIGIAPEKFLSAQMSIAVNAFVPASMVGRLRAGGEEFLRSRGAPAFKVFARLKPGASLSQARAAVDIVAKQLAKDYPDEHKEARVFVVPERHCRPEPTFSEFMPIVSSVFMVMVGLVLLIACANVANLMFSRALSRQREMSIRTAIGASRACLIRQLLVESVLLAVAAGAVGFLLASWAGGLMSRFTPTGDIPIRYDERWDWHVPVFTLVVSVLAGVVTGLAPALRATKLDVQTTLKEGGAAMLGTSRHFLRNALVVSQVAISLFVLAAGGLFVRSLHQVAGMDLGFRKDHLLMASLDLNLQGYDDARGKRFCEQLIEQVKALPGVRSASLGQSVPFDYGFELSSVASEEKAGNKDNFGTTHCNRVDPEYFRTMGTRLLRGRVFTEHDNESAPKVAVINTLMAERLWPGQDPLGKRFRCWNPEGELWQVIGVLPTARYVMIGEEPRPYFYTPLAQHYVSPITLHVWTASDPAALSASVRKVLSELDPHLPIYNLRTMEEHLRSSAFAMLPLRMGATLAGVQGLLGLLLAVMGLYGVVSFVVGQRTREIGIRVALGARKLDIFRLVVRDGLRLTLIGIVIGLAAGLGISGILGKVLYGLTPAATPVLVVTVLTLAIVALLACYVPARRATKVDPMVALRYE